MYAIFAAYLTNLTLNYTIIDNQSCLIFFSIFYIPSKSPFYPFLLNYYVNIFIFILTSLSLICFSVSLCFMPRILLYALLYLLFFYRLLKSIIFEFILAISFPYLGKPRMKWVVFTDPVTQFSYIRLKDEMFQVSPKGGIMGLVHTKTKIAFHQQYWKIE